MTPTIVSSSEILRKLYPADAAVRWTNAMEEQSATLLVVMGISTRRDLTYEHRSRLFGQLRAAKRLSVHRGENFFDARAWWKAHKP